MTFEVSRFWEGVFILLSIAAMIAPLWPGRKKRSHPPPTGNP